MPAPANVAAPAPAPKPTMSISEDAKKVAVKLQREALERIEKGSAELDERSGQRSEDACGPRHPGLTGGTGLLVPGMHSE